MLERNGLTGADLDLFVSHQANRRIIEAAAERLGLDPDKVVINLEHVRQHDRRHDPAGAGRRARDGRLKKAISCCSRRSAPGSRSGRCCCAGGFEDRYDGYDQYDSRYRGTLLRWSSCFGADAEAPRYVRSATKPRRPNKLTQRQFVHRNCRTRTTDASASLKIADDRSVNCTVVPG